MHSGGCVDCNLLTTFRRADLPDSRIKQTSARHLVPRILGVSDFLCMRCTRRYCYPSPSPTFAIGSGLSTGQRHMVKTAAAKSAATFKFRSRRPLISHFISSRAYYLLQPLVPCHDAARCEVQGVRPNGRLFKRGVAILLAVTVLFYFDTFQTLTCSMLRGRKIGTSTRSNKQLMSAIIRILLGISTATSEPVEINISSYPSSHGQSNRQGASCTRRPNQRQGLVNHR